MSEVTTSDQEAHPAWPAGPSSPPQPQDEVHLWIANLEAEGWPPAEGLPEAERKRARRIARPEAAARWSAARWALRTVLSRYLGDDPAGIALVSAEGGKPRLAVDSRRLGFNLSHSGGLALIAVAAGREVGVDIERTEAGRDFATLAARSFGPDEVAAIREAAPGRRADLFYAAWTRHEAQVKCAGGSIWDDAPGTPVEVVAVGVGAGYAAALAVAGTPPPRLHEWSIGPPGGRVRR